MKPPAPITTEPNVVDSKGEGKMPETKGRQKVSRLIETVILIALPIVCHYLLPITRIIPKPYTYLGIVLMLLGVILSMWGSSKFRRAGASYQLKGESSVLVTSGPFRISRNPLYLAMLFWLLGMAVLLGSLTPFLFPVLLFIIANFFMIPIEERQLEQTMGQPYLDYKMRVRRWL
jgi:protein-S-isoprenylcysteine O-methyltransferase Ste14